MKLIKYSYNNKEKLTEHFSVNEWKCKCGKNHNILIANNLPILLEKLMNKIGAKKGNILSGYRCNNYDKKIGGTGSITHQGYACDIKFYDENNKAITSKIVVLALEDIGHKYGIGYKSGGSKYVTHIDVRKRKWFGDESKSMTKNCCNSFYDYFGLKKSGKKLQLLTGVYGRIGGIGFDKKRLLFNKGTMIKNVTFNVGIANSYKWIKGYVNNKLIYFPYKSKWFKSM